MGLGLNFKSTDLINKQDWLRPVLRLLWDVYKNKIVKIPKNFRIVKT
jgi:hypothetical protein